MCENLRLTDIENVYLLLFTAKVAGDAAQLKYFENKEIIQYFKARPKWKVIALALRQFHCIWDVIRWL